MATILTMVQFSTVVKADDRIIDFSSRWDSKRAMGNGTNENSTEQGTVAQGLEVELGSMDVMSGMIFLSKKRYIENNNMLVIFILS